MIEFYGTYLIVLVRDTLRQSEVPLSVKEIGLQIHQYDDHRLQRNFELRIRNALRNLVDQDKVKYQTCSGQRNLIIFKYSILQHEEEHSGSAEKP